MADKLNAGDKVEDKDKVNAEDKIEEKDKAEDKDEVEEPKEGMMFDTSEELMELYSRHGNKLGFQVRRRTCRKGDDGELEYVVFACCRSGKPRPTSSRNAFRMRPFSRTDCKAKLNAAICADGKWRVTSIAHDHNHPLCPGKIRYRPFGKRKLDMNDKAGMRVKKDFNSGAIEAGGSDKVRRLRLGQGDGNAMQNYFMKMQANNSNFFYTLDWDGEGYLRNVFWADARSRKAYEEFGEVITFDTTYLTSKYDMPFVSFVGVNHHGQLMLLGCGLLSSEDNEAYTWLFQSWLSCMSGCAPKAIITDQDIAIQKAVEITFPNTRHRWCLWHLMKNLLENMSGYEHSELIKFAFQKVVYDSLTPGEFEEWWNEIIEKYSLQSNEWLVGLYDERHRWVPAYLKDTFWAGMSTTQHTESLDAFFNGYINSKTTIKQFVEQYENALRTKVEKEYHEDLNSFNSRVPCITNYVIEKQFQDAYTTTKFKEFQHELTVIVYCELTSVKRDFAYSEYEVSDSFKGGEIGRRVTFKVSIIHDDCDVHCSCGLFESRGILCRHAFIVLIHHKILRVPEKYIIPRWRKDIKRRHTKVKVCYDDWSSKPEAQRFDKLCTAFSEVADFSNDFEEKTKMVLDSINQLKKELKKDEIQPTITMNDGTIYFCW